MSGPKIPSSFMMAISMWGVMALALSLSRSLNAPQPWRTALFSVILIKDSSVSSSVRGLNVERSGTSGRPLVSVLGKF